ncbi:sulfurtransferase TusA family protein [Helicobacter sp. MIT 21-1697]|uniref:sulfurtransferase TusA family protein n=1 Tax=Helicobacter sp. MIT 21-1697 TaxID=2993733 RepID=UPI00224A5FEC|nr:sulfurtransferase TusA family protein [Helicobacter sp. MIT 21-1697]MCX2717753.1 sulfurtransferase TusA family protein [Helicobacter sp. MIT 21-1697]
MITIDIRGLSCPQPAIEVSNVLKTNPQSFKVICDLSSPIDNIITITQNYSYALVSQEGKETNKILLFCKTS